MSFRLRLRNKKQDFATEASGRSLLHEWEARCELPATQRVGLLFQKDVGWPVSRESGTAVMTDVRGIFSQRPDEDVFDL